LRLICGDQLNSRHTWYQQIDKNIVYVMMEVRSEADRLRHHAQQLIGIFAAMRAFAKSLARDGHTVHYLKIGDLENRHSFAENLTKL
jgi:deoxyribodipyrimidine photolyase-related protein